MRNNAVFAIAAALPAKKLDQNKSFRDSSVSVSHSSTVVITNDLRMNELKHVEPP